MCHSITKTYDVMKALLNYFMLIFLIPLLGNAQTEILIVGTAHDLPEGLEFNYTPILEITEAWRPDVICTEFRKPDDTKSLTEIYGANIFNQMDSLAKVWKIPTSNWEKEIETLYKQLDVQENIVHRMQLRNLLFLHLDRGNAYFQNYLIHKSFMKLSEKEQDSFREKFPMYDRVERYMQKNQRDEYTLVGFPLAEKLGIPYLFATDDQSLSTPYHRAWGKAFEELKGTVHLESWDKIIKEFDVLTKKHMPQGTALLGLNTYEIQEKLYQLEYKAIEFGINEQADLMSFYWGERNQRMSGHILEVAAQNPNSRIVVFYGASHIPAIRRMLKANSDYRILTLPDLKSWGEYESQLK